MDYHRICFKEVTGFLNVDVFAQMVSSWNASSWRNVTASSSKQGRVYKITRKNSNTSSIQKETGDILNLVVQTIKL